MLNSKFLILNSLALCVAACGAAAPPVTYPVMPSALTPIDADHDKAKDFARVFCSTLPHLKDKDGHAWGDCAKYLEMSEPPRAQAAFSTPYRFLFVAGFGAACFKDVRAFSTSIAHLKTAHQIDVEYFAVAPFASSEENAKSIARQVDAGFGADQSRRFVLVGYSKGTADILEALRGMDDAKSKGAAV